MMSTDKITLARLDELKELVERMTPGPWRSRWSYKKDPPGTIIAAFAAGHTVVTDARGGTMPSADMDGVSALRNEADSLLLAARFGIELEALARELIEAGGWIVGQHPGWACCSKNLCPGGIKDEKWCAVVKEVRVFLDAREVKP